MGDYIQTEAVIESAILVAVELKQQNEVKTKEYLDELAFLARTAGAEVKKAFVQRLEYPNPKTYVGTGKLADIVTYAQENDIDMAIFDDELYQAGIYVSGRNDFRGYKSQDATLYHNE